MDMYGHSAPDQFGIEDLLDFSNEELFSPSVNVVDSAATSSSSDNYPHHHLSMHENPSQLPSYPSITTDFITDDLCVPTDEVAQLEWLSQFVDESFSDFPLTGNLPVQSDAAFSGRAVSKRSRATKLAAVGAVSADYRVTGKSRPKNEASSTTEEVVRRCTHCASEKTPQWRTGPLGPKTLCNACGVRYKSGRLVPEYRPVASPTFVLTQHSNSHRKVMELRRQKEETREEEEPNIEVHQEEPKHQHNNLYRHQIC